MAKLDKFDEWVAEGMVDNSLAVIQSMSMQGKTLDEIASKFGLSERQLCRLQNKHPSIKTAIKKGRDSVVAMCQSKLMDLVRSGDTTAVIYALKIYGGDFFNDRRQIKAEITGADGKPVKVELRVKVYLPERELL